MSFIVRRHGHLHVLCSLASGSTSPIGVAAAGLTHRHNMLEKEPHSRNYMFPNGANGNLTGLVQMAPCKWRPEGDVVLQAGIKVISGFWLAPMRI